MLTGDTKSLGTLYDRYAPSMLRAAVRQVGSARGCGDGRRQRRGIPLRRSSEAYGLTANFGALWSHATRMPVNKSGSVQSSAPAASIWTAPTNARFAPLQEVLERARGVAVDVNALREEARVEVGDRASAYRTPVTRETLRRCVP